MARVLDLNNVQESLLDLTLRDADRTVVHLDIPNEALINELQNMGPELEKMKTGNASAIASIYDLAVRLINCNFDGFTTNREELVKKYGMHLVATLTFFNAYMDAIKELAIEKN